MKSERESNPRLRRQKAIDRQYSNTFSTITRTFSHHELSVQNDEFDEFEAVRIEASAMFHENNGKKTRCRARMKPIKQRSLEIFSFDDLNIA